MKKILFIFLIGLTIFEIFSFIFVYFSNKDLFTTITILNQTNHLVVPNIHVLPSLEKFLPAFCGSLFITFTAGVALSFVICLVAMFILHPPVFQSQNSSVFLLVSLAGFIISGLIFFAHPDQGVFLRARDYLFLSNKPGIMINNFYYRYTPYASQAINAPLQKQMKTCWIDYKIRQNPALNTLFLKSGWFDVPNKSDAFLVIEKSSENLLLLKQKKKIVLYVSMNNFEDDPVHYLKEFSQKADSKFLLRSICSAGLFVVMPFVCFMTLFSGIFFLYNRWINYKPAIYLSGISMVVIALTGLLYLNPMAGSKDIKIMLDSQNTRTRIEALRMLYQKGGNIGQIPKYLTGPLNEKSIAEKYWLAKVLSNPYNKNIPYIKKLIKDDAFNVRYASIKALSLSGCSEESTKLFKEIVETSTHWYEQYYALKAFRSCQ